MAKITSFEGKIPKRIGNYVVYRLDDQLIVRANSGFTSKGLKQKAKYALCLQNASEFGLLSKTCKAIRQVVADGLTLHNNLQVVNNLTKKMRSVLVYDTLHDRGNRNLKTALATSEAQNVMKGYAFTPDFKLQLQVTPEGLLVTVPEELLEFSNGYLGFCVQYLFFDFDSLTGYLERTTWQMEPLNSKVSFVLPVVAPGGVLLSMYRFSFFSLQEGEWLPVLPEQKGLVVF